MLSALGRREAALEATQEAVEIRRFLAASRPDAFLPDLARSLNNLGNRLIEVGREEEARTVSAEALDLLWPFFERYPVRFTQLAEMMLRDDFALFRGEPPAKLLERLRSFTIVMGSLQREAGGTNKPGSTAGEEED